MCSQSIDIKRLLVSFALSVGLIGGTACSNLATAKKPESPKAAIQAGIHWKASKENPVNPSDLTLMEEFPDKQWWTAFQDSYLTGYINQAVIANHQLAVAQARIKEAKASTQSAYANLFPAFRLEPNFTRVKTSQNQFPSFGGGGISSLGNFILKPYNIFTAPIQVNYEADFFLKNWDRVRSSKVQTEATLQDYRTATIALISEVSSTYFNLMAADKLISLQQDLVRVSGLDLEAEKAREEEGLAAHESVVIKEGILTDAKAALQDYFRLQSVYENQLAILIAQTPENANELPRADLDNIHIPEAVSAGIPSEVITRRPDIIAAERMLEASRINVTIARKNFLPSLNLSLSRGFASTMLDSLFKKASDTWNISGTGGLGLFEGGAKVAGLKQSRAQLEQQLHNYQQVILTSLQEADNAIVALKTHRNAYQEYNATNNSLRQQLSFQQAKVEEGAIAVAALYPTEIQVLQSRQGLVQAKLLGLVDTLDLYKALGGGY